MKEQYGWPQNKYLNIYVIRSAGGQSGSAWAYYPSSAQSDPVIDGIVSSHWAIGRTGTATPTHYKILTHEAGHWANLAHTFSGGCSGSGDNVSDTPPCTTGSGCNLTDAPCGVLANRQNYMDYGDCTVMFTKGQETRMRAALSSSTGSRNNLWTSSNLSSTGVEGQAVSALFYITKNFTTPGGSIDFTDVSEAEQGSVSSWTWSFPGGTPSSFNGQNPPDVTYNTAGVYDVTLTVSNGSSSNTVTKEDYITVSTNIYMHTNTVSVSSGKFYDDGYQGDYANREDHTLTMLPATSGSKVKVVFTSFTLENNCSNDYLKIYDGSSTNGTLIGTYCGSNSPGTVQATNAEGALTFVFHANVETRYAGWVADVSTAGGSTDTEPPTAPSGLTSTGKTATSVSLSWTASIDNVGVTAYDVYNGSSVATTVGNTTATVNGLTPNNSYNFTIVAKDAAENESSPSNQITVTTDPGSGCTYCTLSGDDQGYEWITGVQVGNFSKTSGKENGGYSDFTSETINLTAGEDVSVTLTPNTTQYTEHFKVWIDYNGDCDFEDSGEEVLSGSAQGNTTGTINVSSGVSGTTRMRVAMQYNATPPSSCGTFQYGEIEDYTVVISDGGSDTQAPSVPTGLSSSNITQTSVSLSWNPSTDNVGVTGYDVLQNGSVVESPGGISVTLSGLSAATTYSFTVRAKDAANNISAVSTVLSVTTLDEDCSEPPAAPVGIASSNITTSSVDLNWQEVMAPCMGETVSYDVMQNGAFVKNVAGTSTTITGLAENTTYVFTIRAKDSAGNASALSSEHTVTTDTGGGTLPTYCAAQGNAGPEYIAQVQFGTINNSSARDNYHDYTGITTNVTKGSSYTLSVTIGTPYNSDNEATAFIDWNIDGDFEDSGETFILTKNSDSEASLSIAVPSDAFVGLTGMRIRVSYYDTQNTTCGDNSYGEVEDYALNITPGAKSTIAKANAIVEISPNPTNGIVQIKTNKEGIYAITVTDFTGKVVKVFTGENDVTSIDLSDLSDGIYLVNVEGIVEKLIKK